MAVPMLFLKLTVDGTSVVGDAVVDGYAKQIACESLEWDISTVNPGKTTTTDVRAAVQPKEIEFTKFVDSASPALYTAMLESKKFSSAVFTLLTMMRGSSETIPKLMTLELNDGFVRRVDVSISGGGKALVGKETVTLSYLKSKLMYYPYDQKKGTRAAPTTFQLDVKSVT